MQQGRHAKLLDYLERVVAGKNAVVDFTFELLRVVGYFRRRQLARRRVEFPLWICGENKRARTDVCIIDRAQNDRVLLVVRKGDKKRSNVARAQLVAEAVGAFTENQTARKTMGLAPLTEEVSHLLISRSC